MLPSEALHTLQDGVIAELQAQEQRMFNIISDQKVKKSHMFVGKTSVIDLLKNIQEKNECTIAVVAKACRTISELHIPEDTMVNARIQKLTIGVCGARTELPKVQFELKFKITGPRLKAKPSTPPDVREQREASIKDAIATVDAIVKDYTTLFEQSLEVVTNLQEDPNLHRLEIEEREL